MVIHTPQWFPLILSLLNVNSYTEMHSAHLVSATKAIAIENADAHFERTLRLFTITRQKVYF